MKYLYKYRQREYPYRRGLGKSRRVAQGARRRMGDREPELTVRHEGAGVRRMKVPLGKLSVQLHSYPSGGRRIRFAEATGTKEGERPFEQVRGP
jgi:hypothetical protein